MGLGNFSDRADVVESNYLGVVLTVGTTEVEVKAGGSRLATRQLVALYNDSSNTIYFGPTGVSTSGSSKGIPLAPQQFLSIPIGNAGLYLIAGSASNNVIVQELG